MNIKYFSWSDLLNMNVEHGAIHSIEIHPKIRDKADELIQVYLVNQSKALAEFEKLKSLINEVLSEHGQLKGTNDAELNDLLVEVEWIIEEPVHDESSYIEAQLMVYANLISARLGWLVVSAHHDIRWLDPRDIIVTDENWTQATVDLALSRVKFKRLNGMLAYISSNGIGTSPDNQNTLTANLRSWDLF